MAIKPLFANFGSDHVKVHFFQANGFYCCINEFGKAICFPLLVSSAKMAVKPPFANFGSDHIIVSAPSIKWVIVVKMSFEMLFAFPYPYLPKKGGKSVKNSIFSKY